jgi:hypothetical protein
MLIAWGHPQRDEAVDGPCAEAIERLRGLRCLKYPRIPMIAGFLPQTPPTRAMVSGKINADVMCLLTRFWETGWTADLNRTARHSAIFGLT